MHLALSTSLLQQPKQVCLPRPSFVQSPRLEEEEKQKNIIKTDNFLEPYVIFAQCSVNLISCSSNSGKTRFLKEVISHRTKFFENPETIRRIL